MNAVGNPARMLRIGEMLVAVARQLLEDRAVGRIALLDDGSPEAALCARLLAPLQARLVTLRPEGGRMDSVLHAAGVSGDDPWARAEAQRFLLRLVLDAVPCSAISKTDLLVGGELPPEPFLPLGDLYASELIALGGDWRGTPAAQKLAARAGGITRLDEALRAHLDDRDTSALERLPGGAGSMVAAALAVGASSRVYPRLVPKLGTRTIGVDLFE